MTIMKVRSVTGAKQLQHDFHPLKTHVKHKSFTRIDRKKSAVNEMQTISPFIYIPK